MDALFNFIGSIFGYVLYFFNSICGNFGVSIILFTLFTRLLMFPLTIKQQKSMAGMQRLQPKMKELQDKYGNDKAKYNEEVQKLYQREGQSPAGGCLPMLIQLPIFYGLYRAICMPLTCTLHLDMNDTALASAMTRIKSLYEVYTPSASSFYSQINVIEAVRNIGGDYAKYGFTAAESATLEPIFQLSKQFNFLGIDLLSIAKFWNPAIILTFVVFAASAGGMLLTNKLTGAANQSQMNGCSPNMMGISMGLMSAWISLSVPSAMALYWTCSSLFAPAQSWVVNKYYNAAILNAKSEAQRLAKIRLEEEAVVSETYSKKGIKKFAPIYAIPQAAEAEQTSSEEVTEEVSEPTKTAAKKSASSKKKKGGSKGNQSSSAYQGKKKK
ncbi:MAG: YidC/Oxa1 family membrane protein insertase [Clostridia bacterium]|nr:YidC/Oxa1 family membrane protein insertase [Clostridia bacterium]